MARTRSAKRTIDFSDVEEKSVAPEGRALLKVVELTLEKGEKGEYYKWQFEVAKGKGKGASVYHNTSLSPQSLWNLKKLLDAFGVDTEGEIDLDPADFVDALVEGDIFHERYQGAPQARIVEFFPAEEGADEEEEEKPKKGRGRKAKPVDDDEEEEEAKPARRGRKAVVEEEEEEEEKPARKARGRGRAAKVEEEEEEEDEKPARGRRGKAPAKKPAKVEEEEVVTADDINGFSQEELEDYIEENDLDVDLDGVKSLKKMRSTVIDAAEEAGLLDE